MKLFGTDGIRAKAGEFPLDSKTVRMIGASLARHLIEQTGGRTPVIVTGRDTRESGPRIEEELIAGALASGASVQSAGIITTPGVAYLARTLPADAGVVISASHNPYQDDGIKIFSPSGRKLDDATERLIEADIEAEKGKSFNSIEPTDAIEAEAEAEHAAALRERYSNYLAEEVADKLTLEGLSMVVDCANGAAFEIAPALFERLGARVVHLNDNPDGRNINLDCGSLHIEGLRQKVEDARADLGVAFDGDADRALFVDASGQFVDGDATLWVMAQYLSERGRLDGETVVATVMSNLGLELALRSKGL